MSKLAIGMFDAVTTAESAVEALEELGFKPEEVELVSSREDFEAGPPLGPLDASRSESSLGTGAGVAHATFHAGLIRALSAMGMAQHEAEDYAEGVRRGAALVLVKTNDDRADDAAELMDRNGACQVEDRVAQCTSKGWQRQFSRAAQERGLEPKVTEGGGVQAGRVRYGSGGARVFVW